MAIHMLVLNKIIRNPKNNRVNEPTFEINIANECTLFIDAEQARKRIQLSIEFSPFHRAADWSERNALTHHFIELSIVAICDISSQTNFIVNNKQSNLSGYASKLYSNTFNCTVITVHFVSYFPHTYTHKHIKCTHSQVKYSVEKPFFTRLFLNFKSKIPKQTPKQCKQYICSIVNDRMICDNFSIGLEKSVP